MGKFWKPAEDFWEDLGNSGFEKVLETDNIGQCKAILSSKLNQLLAEEVSREKSSL